ncbi:hypothetical protein K458DRAFT_482396 [Lentithecium fluviatile CBS 122367]|uniref:F-box domain-containing protein n=1 Tax=Lentithecium fluviatile CBS 122367 TaxID=1168545 RepID=A0A6G1JND0_9PLEO|nr:hypothetical protein K458DRAFT_482396 [Lentithecium fluviatile CBS 122367]
MSLQGLPVELKLSIVEHLHDTGDLNSVSQVSKEFHGIAEPFLYRNLTFSNGHMVKRLLFALLHRNGLALHIQQFKYMGDTEQSSMLQRWTPGTTDALWNHVPNLYASIGRYGNSFGWNTAKMLSWLCDMCTLPLTVDAAMCLIFCMAVNIKSVGVLYSSELGDTIPWIRELQGGAGSAGIPPRLRELTVGPGMTYYGVSVPVLRELHVSGMSADSQNPHFARHDMVHHERPLPALYRNYGRLPARGATSGR